jgi:ADP-ribose pyrophosphatase
MPMPETTLSSTPVFQGRLLTVEVHEVEIEPGVRARREIVRHPGAVGVLARDADGRFLFVRQFRKPINRELMEIVAGGLEKGESPSEAAVRELAEESGRQVQSLRPLGLLYPAPGYTDEVIHLFFAELSNLNVTRQGDPDERILVEYLTPDEIETRLSAGTIEDGKTLAAWLLFTRGIDRQKSAQSSPVHH